MPEIVPLSPSDFKTDYRLSKAAPVDFFAFAKVVAEALLYLPKEEVQPYETVVKFDVAPIDLNYVLCRGDRRQILVQHPRLFLHSVLSESVLDELIVVDNHDNGLSVHPLLDLFLAFADYAAAGAV